MDDGLAPRMPGLIRAWRVLQGRAPADSPLTPDERRAALGAIARLSHGLTRERALAGARYFDDPALLGAYLLLYWPVSYAQGRAVLGELGAPPGAVLDLGSGPGPLAAAALDLGARSVLACDRHARALALARTLGGPALTTRTWEPDRPAPDGTFDTILLGHVLNELFLGDIERRAALVDSLAARLAPGGRVVVVEPALRETSRALLGVRDRLLERGWSVRAPCLYRGPCPALVRASDWCHAERPFAPPPLAAELARAARLHRDALKMTYLVLAPPGAGWPELPAGRLFRIVSEPLDDKGRHRRIGCGPEGRLALTLKARDVGDGNRAFLALARGDVARLDGLTPRGDGLHLAAESPVERIARAGEPPPRNREPYPKR